MIDTFDLIRCFLEQGLQCLFRWLPGILAFTAVRATQPSPQRAVEVIKWVDQLGGDPTALFRAKNSLIPSKLPCRRMKVNTT